MEQERTTHIEKTLSNLAKKYDIRYSIFDRNVFTARIVGKADYEVVTADGSVKLNRGLYLEVHANREGDRSFRLFIPSDANVPVAVARRFSTNSLTVPNSVKRLFRKSAYGHRHLGEDRRLDDMAIVLDELFSICSVARVDSAPRAGLPQSPSPTVTPKPKMRIVSVEGGPTLERRQHPNYREGYKVTSLREEGSDYTVYLSLKAIDEIFEHIKWEQKTDENIVEQGGLYLGNSYSNSEHGDFSVVSAALPARATRGSATYVEFTHAIWNDLIEEINNLKVAGIFDENWVILGWYHTHPNDLDVFMSGTDMNTQRKLFYNSWNSALVLNPHRGLARAFRGQTAAPANLRLIEQTK